VPNSPTHPEEPAPPFRAFRVAAFRANEEASIEYTRLTTLRGLLRHIEHLVQETSVDYVSLRIIRERRKKD